MPPEPLDRLYRAVRAGDLAGVRARLDAGLAAGELEYVARDTGLRPTHEAARRIDAEILALLLDAGAQIEAKSTDGNTPLIEAVRRNCLATARLLLARGADAKAVTMFGATLAHLATRSNNPELVAMVLDAGADHSTVNGKGETPLMVAVRHRHREMVSLLLARGADPHLLARAEKGAVDRAIDARATGLATLLLEHGAPKTAAQRLGGYLDHLAERQQSGRLTDDDCATWMKLLAPVGVPPLVAVLEWGHAKFAALLLARGADPNQASTDGRTPLGAALARGAWQDADMLLAAGARSDAATPEARRPLATALREAPGHLLLKLGEAGLKLDGLDSFDWPGVLRDAFVRKDDDAFEAARRAGRLDAENLRLAVQAALTGRDQRSLGGLLARGADANRALDNGKTPLEVALSSQRWQQVEELLAHHARPRVSSPEEWQLLARVLGEAPSAVMVGLRAAGVDLAKLEGFDWAAARALAARRGDAGFFDLARESGQLTASDALAAAKGAIHSDSLAVLQHLAGADAPLTELLACAVKERRAVMVAWLLERGADPNQGVPLLAALGTNDGPAEAMAHALLSAGARCDVDRDGVTALHLAAGLKHPEAGAIVKSLLDGGAVLQARTPNGQTALHRAAATGGGSACETLLAAGADPELRDNEGRSARRLAFDRLASDSGVDTFLVFTRPEGIAKEALARHRRDAILRAIHDKNVALTQALLAVGVPLDFEYSSYLGSWAHLSPLCMTVESDQIELLRELLDHGASVDFWQTAPRALTLALLQGSDAMVALLLERGADPNLRSGKSFSVFDNHTYTDDERRYRGTDKAPLETASYNASKTRLLLDHGADPLLVRRPIAKFGEDVRPLLLAALEAKLPGPARAILPRWKEFETWKQLYDAALASLRRPVSASWHPSRSLVAHAEAGGTVYVSAWHPEALFLEQLQAHELLGEELGGPLMLRWSRDGQALAVDTVRGPRVLVAEGTTEHAWAEPCPRSHDGAWRAELGQDRLVVLPA